MRVQGFGAAVDTYLPLEKGLNALYGLNGAGKTTILTAIRAALQQSPLEPGSRVTFYLRVVATRDELEADPALGRIARALELTSTGDLAQRIGETLVADWTQCNATVTGDPIEFGLEIGNNCLFELSKNSWPEPNWTIAISVRADAGPCLVKELHAFRTFWRSQQATLDAPENDTELSTREPLEQMRSRLRRSPFSEARELDFDPWSEPLCASSTPIAVGSRKPLDGPALLSTRIDLQRDVDASTLIQLQGLIDGTLQASPSWHEQSSLLRPEVFGSDGRLSPWMMEASSWLERRANEVYASILVDAPRLTLSATPPENWLTSPLFRWTAESGRPGGRVAIAALSTGQERWARFSVLHAVSQIARDPAPLGVVFIDEPEMALHRSAEHQMAHALADLGASQADYLLVATHSPAILDLAESHVLHIRRGLMGRSEVATLRVDERRDLAALGLRPSDLLNRQKLFVLVEGEHDKIVIEHLLEKRLNSARATVLPLRGARELPLAVESRVLFDFTDAHIVVVLDNTAAEHVATSWTSAQSIRLLEGVEAAGEYLRSQLPGKRAEYKFLREFLSRCLQAGTEDRVTPFGLEKEDIVEYLPAQALVRARFDWPRLRELHRDSNSSKDFKTWLTGSYQGDFSNHQIAVAAALLSEPPEEFEELGRLLNDKAS